MRLSHYVIPACLLLMGSADIAHAGPPYLTDDPEPVEQHHFELYGFVQRDQAHGQSSTLAPAVEMNYGSAPDTQLHIQIPYAHFSQGGVSTSGIGDSEFAVKYRFIHETPHRPQVGFFPAIEIPTGDQAKGLGNGRAWYKFPLWAQKSWGPWTTYGGVGYAYNTAPGQRDYFYGGQLVQREISPKLTLGGEIFLQGAQQIDTQPPSGLPGTRSSTLWNLGGQYNFNPGLSLLFSGGRSFHGDHHSIMYIGLYRTWGPKEK